MTNCRNDERRLEILEQRHVAADNRYLDKLDRDEAKVRKAGLIGELCREGKTVYYINLRDCKGNINGKTKEGDEFDLTKYLIRNGYV